MVALRVSAALTLGNERTLGDEIVDMPCCLSLRSWRETREPVATGMAVLAIGAWVSELVRNRSRCIWVNSGLKGTRAGLVACLDRVVGSPASHPAELRRCVWRGLDTASQGLAFRPRKQQSRLETSHECHDCASCHEAGILHGGGALRPVMSVGPPRSLPHGVAGRRSNAPGVVRGVISGELQSCQLSCPDLASPGWVAR